MEAPSIDDILMRCIDSLWNKYDDDGSGYLDKDETKVFILESIHGDEKPPADELDKMDSHFNACFKIVDVDNNGTISKDEMLGFIKLITGFDEDE